MKKLAGGFALCVLGVVATVTYWEWPPQDVLSFGTFIVLALTLIILVCYAYDTNSIARITRDRWAREGVLSAVHSMELIGKKGEAGRTLFRIHNPSNLVLRASVACNFRVYGEPVDPGTAYNGQDAWLVFPQEMNQGWFEIESLLNKKGKTVASMIAESTPANRTDQFTMLLELEFWDELGARRKLPARARYFDFDRWAWIPHITETRLS